MRTGVFGKNAISRDITVRGSGERYRYSNGILDRGEIGMGDITRNELYVYEEIN